MLINDNGAALDGSGSDAGPAQELVEEIKAAGGEAVACTESVTTPEGGKAIIEAALDSFGKIDILIHSAGNSRFCPLENLTHEEFRSVVDIHLLGGFNVVQPSFPLMMKQGYGRVVLTGSIGWHLYHADRCALCRVQIGHDRAQPGHCHRRRGKRHQIEHHPARRLNPHGRRH